LGRRGTGGKIRRLKSKLKEKDTRRLIIEAAKRLFLQMGFDKTTVADIARELQMSPAKRLSLFCGEIGINEAVCMDLLGKIEAEAEKIAASAAPLRKEYAT